MSQERFTLKNFFQEADSQDSFVGVKFSGGTPMVVLPRGFTISDNNKELRKDLFRLLFVISRLNCSPKESLSPTEGRRFISSIPVLDYQYIIANYLSCGYLSEIEAKYVRSQHGKISWKRTMALEKPYVSSAGVVYLSFQSKEKHHNTENILSQIHKFCVYQSFLLFGWLYFDSCFLPEKPHIRFNRNYFLAILRGALANTFNDNKKKLLQCMINVVESVTNEVDVKNVAIGVNDFSLVWEKLVDSAFGEEEKGKYFPRAKWYIWDRDIEVISSSLRPDTIMKYQDNVYVLDAKYYRYGITYNPDDLPSTSSIQKQITYAKHIVENFSDIKGRNVYNAFIMPAALPEERVKVVGVGLTTWDAYNESTPNFSYVLGILMDSRWIISHTSRKLCKDVEQLANLIDSEVKKYREMRGV